MKINFKQLFSVLLLSFTTFSLWAFDPTLVIVLMVKNEAPVIRETLQPFVDAGIDSYLIFDTGSTDDTIELTRAFFEKNSIKHGYIFQEPFIDFGTSRNRALELAEQQFPQAGFMLMLDAEWYMHEVADLLIFCKSRLYSNCPAYMVRIKDSYIDFYTARLIRCRTNTRFAGPVHETLEYATREKVPPHVYFELRTSHYGQEKTRKRWLRDKDLLLKELELRPDSPRTTFYLAQTYDCLGDLENARIWYERRITIEGWDEENFMAHYRLAKVYEAQGNWEKALPCYLKAYSMRPTRIEPLVCITQHYWDTGDRALCYLFARHAAEAPYPKDTLFVEKRAYDITRHDLLGRSAWYVNDYELGEKATRKALEADPHASHLKDNLDWYIKRKD
jgi:tetratricopeptide (TPR) repeat protein